ALGAPGGGVRPGEGDLLLDEELPHRNRAGRSRRAHAQLRVLRPGLSAAREGAALVARAGGGGGGVSRGHVHVAVAVHAHVHDHVDVDVDVNGDGDVAVGGAL